MLLKDEAEFARKHKHDTDEELFNYLKSLKAQYGKQLNPLNTIGYIYLTERLGSWNDVMGRINQELKTEKECERIETK